MPKLIPVPDDLSKEFWDSVNQKRLILRCCSGCNRLQYPPRAKCGDCGSEKFEAHEVSGRGHINSFIVVEDGRLDRRKPDQPFNVALITLDDDPRINFYSNLPGVPAYEVPIGAPVQVIFEEVDPGQLVHEWQLVKEGE